MKIERLLGNPPEPGQLDEEAEAALDRLDDALMKRGTLGAEHIDWAQIKLDAVAVLDKCLHLQALRGLVFALCQSKTEADLSRTLALTKQAFAANTWGVLHPQGARAERKRQQWAADVLLAILQSLKQVDLAVRGLPAELLAAAQSLTALAQGIKLDTQSWQAGLGELRLRGQASGGKGAPEDERSGSASRALDAKGRAELRRDLRSLAERITRHDPSAEVAFLLRRYAALLEFSSLPPADTEGRVEQQPMPANIADEFKAAVDRPSDAVLARLEDRLFNSPDWFEGHRFAAKIAHSLGYDLVAETIRISVARRLTALPGLAKLRYANGASYLDPSIATWAQVSLSKTQNQAQNQPVVEKTKAAEPVSLDLQARISLQEGLISQGQSRRARAVAKLALAREFVSSGLAGHARLLLQELGETLSEPVLATWDKDLADEVRAEISRLGRQ